MEDVTNKEGEETFFGRRWLSSLVLAFSRAFIVFELGDLGYPSCLSKMISIALRSDSSMESFDVSIMT
jgi:hypothetical protein